MLGDDVELDFAGPALDRIGLGAQPVAGALPSLDRSLSHSSASDPPAAITSSCRRLFNSVPAYFIIDGLAGCASPAFNCR